MTQAMYLPKGRSGASMLSRHRVALCSGTTVAVLSSTKGPQWVDVPAHHEFGQRRETAADPRVARLQGMPSRRYANFQRTNPSETNGSTNRIPGTTRRVN